MARRNLKVIVAYIGFVGLPVLGLLGILRIGCDLTAPVSLAGLWKAAINVDQSASCMREAGVLGSLMNTRGLMELVILNIGMEIGVISQQLFSMMVMMALITTFLTSLLLSLLYREEPAKDMLDGIAKARAVSPMSA